METESTGRSLALRGVGGTGERQGVCGRSTRELERRRPHEARVSGGRTFVEEARWRLGGGAGVKREEDMARMERRKRRTQRLVSMGVAGAYTYERWARCHRPTPSLIFLFQAGCRHHRFSIPGHVLPARSGDSSLLTSSCLCSASTPPTPAALAVVIDPSSTEPLQAVPNTLPSIASP